MNIYISNLSNAVKNETLSELFSKFGEVTSAEVARDAFTGQSRGFGYIQMEDEEAAKKAIESLHNTTLENLTISVRQADPVGTHQGSYKLGSEQANAFKARFN